MSGFNSYPGFFPNVTNGGPSPGVFYPQVNTFADLPDPAANAGKINIVLTSTGTYMINRKEAGMYYSNGVAWSRLGNTPGFFASNTFQIYDATDNTKQLTFNVSGISSGQSRSIIMPDYNVNLGLIPSASLTNKSVLFYNGTSIAQDNTNFNYDSATRILAIGSSATSGSVDVTGTVRTYDPNGTPQFRTALDTSALNTLRIAMGFSTIAYSSSTTTIAHSASTTYTTPGGTAANNGIVFSKNGQITTTTGDSSVVRILGTFSPSSGSSQYLVLNIVPTYNQTVTATGTVRGIYYNPTITSVLGAHYAWESTSGNMLIGGSGNLTVGGNIDIASGVLSTGSGRVTARSIWPDLSTRSLGDPVAIWNKAYFAQLYIAGGSNARVGQATLAAGTVTIANTTITTKTRIFTMVRGAASSDNLSVSATVNNTSFTISSSNVADTRTFDWWLVEEI